MIRFSNFCLNDMERNKWNTVLDKLPPGLQKDIITFMFCKSTNGTGDKITCPHFRAIIDQLIEESEDATELQNISLDMDWQRIVQLILGTSVWVKNTVVILKVLKYVKEVWRGEFPRKMEPWLECDEIGTKTAALLLFCLTGKAEYCPCDMHVMDSCEKLGYTNAMSEDELCWQLRKWLTEEYNIAFNDAVGSIAQKYKDGGFEFMLQKGRENPDEFPQMRSAIRGSSGDSIEG